MEQFLILLANILEKEISPKSFILKCISILTTLPI